jgi:DNA-binding response OmpR family regulator
MQGRSASNFCIVDDDTDFVHFLIQYLEARDWSATGFASGEELLKSGRLEEFDFFILDLGLPGIDGVDLITLVRAKSDAGILIVSGRMGPDAFNSALSAGADMFINKPVRFDQIFHAIASVSRRLPQAPRARSSWTLASGLDALVTPEGLEIALSSLEGHLLARLVEADGAPVSREELAIASGVGGGPEYRNLDAAVFRLRRKIEREADQPSPLRTVHGIGYQLVGEVTAAGREP